MVTVVCKQMMFGLLFWKIQRYFLFSQTLFICIILNKPPLTAIYTCLSWITFIFFKKKTTRKYISCFISQWFLFFLGQHFYKRSQYFLCDIKKTFRKHLFGIQINVNIQFLNVKNRPDISVTSKTRVGQVSNPDVLAKSEHQPVSGARTSQWSGVH